MGAWGTNVLHTLCNRFLLLLNASAACSSVSWNGTTLAVLAFRLLIKSARKPPPSWPPLGHDDVPAAGRRHDLRIDHSTVFLKLMLLPDSERDPCTHAALNMHLRSSGPTQHARARSGDPPDISAIANIARDDVDAKANDDGAAWPPSPEANHIFSSRNA